MSTPKTRPFPEHVFPVLGICGYSGAGKTTLIESLLRSPAVKGRRICVIKNDVHGFSVDVPGKDTYRCYAAGGDVLIRDNKEGFFRARCDASLSLEEMLRRLSPFYDGFLLEGHKSAPLSDKVWLTHPGSEAEEVPEVQGGFLQVLSPHADRLSAVERIFEAVLLRTWTETPITGAVLIGGSGTRFGSPKHLVETGGRTWLERTVNLLAPHVERVVIVGSGEVPPALGHLPRLWDVPDAVGPIAGMRSVFRWHPTASVLFMPCDLPLATGEAVTWLLAQRSVRHSVVMPHLSAKSPPEPLFAYYDRRAAPLIEQVGEPRRLAESDRTFGPVVPPHLTGAWTNVNTRSELPDGG